MRVTLEQIKAAQEAIRDSVHPTPMEISRSTGALIGSEVYFKYENMQRTGSFKIRGATNRIKSLTAEEKKRGVVASSAGNHAQGVALSAQLAGVKATIVMPATASLNKAAATRGYGAEVVLHGEIYDEAYERAREIEKSTGAVFVPPYEDERIIAGQGTIGLEIMTAVNDLDSVVVPIGGGGLISGIAVAVKSLRPQCRVIGVQAAGAPGMAELYKGGEYKAPPQGPRTIADGIAIKKPSKVMLDSFISKYVDDVVTVSDDEIAAAMVYLLERTKSLVEGSGAVSVAAMLNRRMDLGRKTCAILSGGNIDLNVIAKVVERGLISYGRLTEISLIVDDQPGSLSRLTKILADLRANILDVRHDRVERGLSLRETKIDFLLETTGTDHAEKVIAALRASGARITSAK